jgi:hypothetical protein
MKKKLLTTIAILALVAPAVWGGWKQAYVRLTAPAADDAVLVVDVSDTTMATTGTTKFLELQDLPVSTLVQAAIDAAAGTSQTGFQVDTGNAGPRIKNESGTLAARNGADSAYAPHKAASYEADSVDGENRLAVGNNTARAPAAAANELYPESSIWKINQNGSESAATLSPSNGQITLAGPTAPRTITVPDADTVMMGLETSQSPTNKDLTGTGNVHPAVLGVACSDETSDLTAGSSKVTFRMPYAMTVTAVRANVNTAPVGATLNVDINEGGVSILSTVISIDAAELTSTTAAVPAVIADANLADDAQVTVDIDQVGSTTAGKGLKIWLIGTRIL